MNIQSKASREVQRDASLYLAANPFLTRLKSYDGQISKQEYRTLRGQALSGDVQGAEKGLQNILFRKE